MMTVPDDKSLTPKDHASLSASGSHRWIPCAGAPALEEGLPDQSSAFAEEGTVFHEIMAKSLIGRNDPTDFLGRQFRVVNGKIFDPANMPPKITSDNYYPVDEDMVEYAKSAIDIADEFTPIGSVRHIEQRVDFSRYLGVEEQFGTSDVTITYKREITVIDWKYGVGVRVSAIENYQLMLYALGAIEKFGGVAAFDTVRLVVYQPRISPVPSEWTLTVTELLGFAVFARMAAQRTEEARKFYEQVKDRPALLTIFQRRFLNPGEKQCKFCKAKPCVAAQEYAMAMIADDFIDVDQPQDAVNKLASASTKLGLLSNERLALAYMAAPFVESWLKGVRQQVYMRNLQGQTVPGTKLVRGKQGNRKWRSLFMAQIVMDLGRIAEEKMFTRTIVSPSAAEKHLKKEHPMVWALLQPWIDRAPGKLSVAVDTDTRPAELPPNSLDGDFVDATEGDFE